MNAAATAASDRRHHEIIDIDDPRKTTQPVKEETELVVRPVEGDGDRALVIELPVDQLAGDKPGQAEVASFGEVLEPLDEIVGFAFGRQNSAETIEIELVVADVLFESRKIGLGRPPLFDLTHELVDLFN